MSVTLSLLRKVPRKDFAGNWLAERAVHTMHPIYKLAMVIVDMVLTVATCSPEHLCLRTGQDRGAFWMLSRVNLPFQ